MIVWVTDRMNNKEDELAELQDQLEKYQSLLKIASPNKVQNESKAINENSKDKSELLKLYKLAFEKGNHANISQVLLSNA